MATPERPKGPPMLVATDALASPKVRIGHLGGNINLPRTVPLNSLLAGGAGAILGLLISFIIFGGGIGPVIYTTGLGAAAGVFVVTWSPLKGESLAKWFGLQANSRRKKITVNGEAVQLAVGVARLGEVTTGEIWLLSGAINVPSTQYDERGCAIDAEDRFERLLEGMGVAESPWRMPAPGASHFVDTDVDVAPESVPRRRGVLDLARRSAGTEAVLAPPAAGGTPPVLVRSTTASPMAPPPPAPPVGMAPPRVTQPGGPPQAFGTTPGYGTPDDLYPAWDDGAHEAPPSGVSVEDLALEELFDDDMDLSDLFGDSTHEPVAPLTPVVAPVPSPATSVPVESDLDDLFDDDAAPGPGPVAAAPTPVPAPAPPTPMITPMPGSSAQGTRVFGAPVFGATRVIRSVEEEPTPSVRPVPGVVPIAAPVVEVVADVTSPVETPTTQAPVAAAAPVEAAQEAAPVVEEAPQPRWGEPAAPPPASGTPGGWQRPTPE